MRALEGPPGRDPVALAHLLLDLEAQIRKQLQVERDRAAGSIVPAVLQPVHMVDELRVVHAGDPVEVSARTDLLEGPSGSVCQVGGGRHRSALLVQIAPTIWIAYTI
jgi:hypothetical protein